LADRDTARCGHTWRIWGAFSPDERLLATASPDKTAGGRTPAAIGEPLPLPDVRVGALVVDPRNRYLDRARAGQHLPRLVMAVADYQATAVLIARGAGPPRLSPPQISQAHPYGGQVLCPAAILGAPIVPLAAAGV
jgi:hypothetical protein